MYESVCVCACARACGHACGVWAEAERHIQAKDNAVCVCVCAYVCGVGRVSVCWGGRARQCVALWHAQVVVRGWCVWPCECVGVGGGWFVCGVGLLCIGATRARVGRMGVCVWGAPVGAGRQRQRPRETARQRTTLCVCGCGVKGPACGRGVCVVWAAWVCVCVCGVRLWVQGPLEMVIG